MLAAVEVRQKECRGGEQAAVRWRAAGVRRREAAGTRKSARECARRAASSEPRNTREGERCHAAKSAAYAFYGSRHAGAAASKRRASMSKSCARCRSDVPRVQQC